MSRLRLSSVVLCISCALYATDKLLVASQPSAAVAASGNAQATASTNGQTISATGSPGCGATATYGNAYAYASGDAVADVTIKWGVGNTYQTLSLCKGSNLIFSWNTANSSGQLYGLYQITSSSCPSSFNDSKLIVTPATSPSTSGGVTVSLSETGPFYFADPNYCSQGLLQAVNVPSSS